MHLRRGDWRVAPPPARVELLGKDFHERLGPRELRLGPFRTDGGCLGRSDEIAAIDPSPLCRGCGAFVGVLKVIAVAGFGPSFGFCRIEAFQRPQML